VIGVRSLWGWGRGICVMAIIYGGIGLRSLARSGTGSAK